jgi:hypothetical protein
MVGGHRSTLMAGLTGLRRLVLDLGAGTGANVAISVAHARLWRPSRALDAPTPGCQSQRLLGPGGGER